MDLTASTSGYKLEPISEILNPLRFPGYDGSASNTLPHSWHNSYYSNSSSGDGEGTLPRFPVRYPSIQPSVGSTPGLSAAMTVSSQDYYNNGSVTMTTSNNTLPYQPALSNLTTTNINTTSFHDNNAMPCAPITANNEKSCDLAYTTASTTENGSSVKEIDEDSGFKDLSASSSTASSPVKDDEEAVPKYHNLSSLPTAPTTSSSCHMTSTSCQLSNPSVFTDLSTVAKATVIANKNSNSSEQDGPADSREPHTADNDTSTEQDSTCRYTTLLSPTRRMSNDTNTIQSPPHESTSQSSKFVPNLCDSTKLAPNGASSLYQDLNEEYILPKQSSVVAVAATEALNSSPTSGQNDLDQQRIKAKDITKGQGHKDIKENGLNSQEILSTSASNEVQNFGEIIKEGITVETISA